MPYPIAVTPYPPGTSTPNPDYRGVNGLIPTIWSKKLGEKLYANTVLSRVTTMGWSDDDKPTGQAIIVRFPPSITIRPYEANSGPLVVERPDAGVATVPIDYGLYFYALLDDVYEIQSDLLLLDVFAEGASQDMKVALEQYYLPMMPGYVANENKGATAGVISGNINLGTVGAPLIVANDPSSGSNSPVQILARLGQVLDEQGVSSVGRFAIVPPAFAAAIEASPATIGSSGGGYEAGLVGRVARFDVYSSIHLDGTPPPANTAPRTILAGSRLGLAFASGLTALEVLRREDTFATGLRGIQVAGMTCINPKMIAAAVIGGTGGSSAVSAYNSSASLGTDLIPVTPTNGTTVAPNLGLRVRTAGDVVFIGTGGTAARTLTGLQPGQIIPVQIKEVRTGTTATVDLIGA